MQHSDSCKGLHTNMPLGEPLTTSPWALAQWLNASLPFLNKVRPALAPRGQLCHIAISSCGQKCTNIVAVLTWCHAWRHIAAAAAAAAAASIVLVEGGGCAAGMNDVCLTPPQGLGSETRLYVGHVAASVLTATCARACTMSPSPSCWPRAGCASLTLCVGC